MRARQIRQARGLSLRQAADTRSRKDQIIALESGRRHRITLDVLVYLASAYEVELRYLLGATWRGATTGKAPPRRRAPLEDPAALDLRWRRRLRDAREAAQITQSEAARQSGIPQPTINRWESGMTRAPDLREVYAVTRVLGVPIADLFLPEESDP